MARMTVEMSAELDKLLKDLAEKESVTKVEALRRAIVLYHVARRELARTDGGLIRKLGIADDHDKLIKEILLPA